MVDFLPLKAWHPRPEVVAQVASPPYDIVDDDEARSIITAHPHSFLRVEKAEVELSGESTDVHRQAGKLARRNLERLVAEGLLVCQPRENYFVYCVSKGSWKQTGLAGLASCSDYQRGGVLRHEQTRADKAAGRVAHISACGAHTGPVLLVSRPGSGLAELLQEQARGQPLLAATDEGGVLHELWQLDSKVKGKITAWFSGQRHLLIADGHHRAHAAWEVWSQLDGQDEDMRRRAGGFLAVVFPGEEMRLLGYHRLVRLPEDGKKPAEYLAQLCRQMGQAIEQAEAGSAPQPGQPLLVWQKKCWKIALPGGGATGSGTDAELLQKYILQPHLGIGNARSDPRLSFLGGPGAPAKIYRRCRQDPALVGFLLHPPDLEQVFTVASAGGVMPPKSTWFEPKLRSGLLVHRFRE